MNRNEVYTLCSAAAARAGDCSHRFVCPLCLRSFYENDPKVLTVEHVPAKALGGKGLLLTCKNCNSKAGHLLQGNQTERDRQAAFWEGAIPTPFNISVETHFGTIRGTVTYDGSGHANVMADHKRMSPSTIKAFELEKSQIVYNAVSIGRRFNPGRARVADLRDAYLWTFARYGYRAIAFPALDWIRYGIRIGQTSETRWSVEVRDDSILNAQKDKKGPIICFMEKPQGAIFVCRGKNGVILPSIFNQDPYEEIDDGAGSLELPNRVENVPKKLVLGMDFSSELESWMN